MLVLLGDIQSWTQAPLSCSVISRTVRLMHVIQDAVFLSRLDRWKGKCWGSVSCTLEVQLGRSADHFLSYSIVPN